MRENVKYGVIFFLLLFVGRVFIACVDDEDYAVPMITIEEPEVEVNFTIAAVLEKIGSTPTLIESEVPLFLEGYVVSSDEAGNFHKSLVIQDKPENPTAGISISTQATNMYIFYEPGRKVYVRVDGLYVGTFRGLPSLGENAEEIDYMSVAEFDARVLRSNTVEEILPQTLSINQIDEKSLNTLVQLNEVEFLAEYAGLTYAHPENNFGVDRELQDCYSNKVTLRTSGFADFKSEKMPTANGSLTAVVSVFHTTYQLFIRDTEDVVFHDERCEERDLDLDWKMPFKETFSTHSAGVGVYVNLPGWTNINAHGGEGRFEVREFNGNKFAQVSAFGSQEEIFEAWLITPNIHLDKESPVLVFDTKDGFFNGEAFTVHIATDFEENPFTATWEDITDRVVLPVGHYDWEPDFTNSGEVDLSDYMEEKIVIGFRYLGGDFAITTTYQLDNIEIKTAE